MMQQSNIPSGTKAVGAGREVQAVEGEWEVGEIPGQEEEEECPERQKTAAIHETLTTPTFSYYTTQ